MEGGEMGQPDFLRTPPNQRKMALYKWCTGNDHYQNMDDHFKGCSFCQRELKEIGQYTKE